MNRLSHDEAYLELAGVALDSVPAELSTAVREHAAVCPECGPELAAMEDAVAQLAQAVPQAAINPGRGAGIRSRLLMRARGEREARSAIVPGEPPDIARGVASLKGQGHKLTPGTQRAVDAEVRKVVPVERARRMFPGAYVLAAAASIAFIAAAVQLMRVTTDRNALRSQLAASTQVPIDTVKPAAAGSMDSIVAAMAGRDVKIVPLATGATSMGRMVWNRQTNEWMMFVSTMRPPKPGMTYQVWLVTDSAKISAGTFEPDSTGHAMVRATYALDRDALKAVAITEEPAGGMPSPTGPILVSGSAAP